ncbi:hypothetical protein PM085_15660 [Halorubrum ezzemoulense]|uniref:Tat (Twin-arginine translocation) pathway signal sequence n=1 Tax=Halorubrum ezzemoulense TaxID=337243 RepID=A0ABT4Z693_HALEZ|nr:hypothetical protein [Halorubrum ezzemoulense]MDB2293693.1 hypothetical protein [Halorubrum ezzemoulense]
MPDTVTLDDIESSTSRRRWLRWLGGGAGLAGVVWALFGDVDARPLAWSVALDPNVTALNVSPDELQATITGESDADEWALLHEYHDLDEAIATGAVPSLGGEVSVSLADLARDRYPTDRFRFQLVSVVDGENGPEIIRESAVEFSLPPKNEPPR